MRPDGPDSCRTAHPVVSGDSDGAKRWRVLMVHNRYQHLGGEDAVADSEEALLTAHGHTVHRYQRDNRDMLEMTRMEAAGRMLWSRQTTRELTALVQSFRPDVIHVHNAFGLVSPSVYWVARRLGIPLVQTLHNFRLLCPQATFLRNGRICEDCLGGSTWRAVARACWRGSMPETALAVAVLQSHRLIGTWRHCVDAFIVLNEFCRDQFIRGGFPAERLHLKPNFFDLPGLALESGVARSGFLYVGRLSPEKGVALLAEVAPLLPSGVQIRVAGDGPLAASLVGVPGIELIGPLHPQQVLAEMRRAVALLLPSVCYDSFPRSLIEAAANGLPAIASRLGSFPSLIEHGETGLLFPVSDVSALAESLQWCLRHPDTASGMGRAAQRRHQERWQGHISHVRLLEVYEQARHRAQARAHRRGKHRLTTPESLQ